MKRNILLVQSLLVLPLISSSVLFGSQGPKAHRAALEIPTTETPQKSKRALKREEHQRRKELAASKDAQKDTQSESISRSNSLDDLPAEAKQESPETPQTEDKAPEVATQPAVLQDFDDQVAKLDIDMIGQSEEAKKVLRRIVRFKEGKKLVEAVLQEQTNVEHSTDVAPEINADATEQTTAEKVVQQDTVPTASDTAPDTAPDTVPAIPDAFAASVFVSSEEMPLTWTEQARVKVGYYIGLVIARLQENKKEVLETETFFDLFSKAMDQAVTTKDVSSFVKMVELSHDKNLRLTNDVADKAFAFHKGIIDQQVSISQVTIEKANAVNRLAYNAKAKAFRAAINLNTQTFEKDVTKIASDNTSIIEKQAQIVADMHKILGQLGVLNASIRQEATTLSQQKRLETTNLIEPKEVAAIRVKKIWATSEAAPIVRPKKQELQEAIAARIDQKQRQDAVALIDQK